MGGGEGNLIIPIVFQKEQKREHKTGGLHDAMNIMFDL